MQSKIYIIFLALISLFLIIFIFRYIHFLTSNNYISKSLSDKNNNIVSENYQNYGQVRNKYDKSSTSDTVNLPLTTTYSCKNFCGPTATCAITGQQCSADIDCPGCQPYVPPLPPSRMKYVQGDNDAGKLTVGTTPTYSTLTTDMGTRAKKINFDPYSKSPQASLGVNTWRSSFDQGRKMFDRRYKPHRLEYMPHYEKQYSVTGEFLNEGPLPSNA